MPTQYTNRRQYRSGFGFAPVTAAAAGSAAPGVGNLIGLGIGTVVSMIGGIADLFSGPTEEESYAEEIYPVISPFVQMHQIPVFVFWYGLVWGLTPTGQVIQISPSSVKDTIEAPDAGDYIQDYVNNTKIPAAWYQGGDVYDMYYPQKSLAEKFNLASFVPTENLLVPGIAVAALLLLTFTTGKKIEA